MNNKLVVYISETIPRELCLGNFEKLWYKTVGPATVIPEKVITGGGLKRRGSCNYGYLTLEFESILHEIPSMEKSAISKLEPVSLKLYIPEHDKTLYCLGKIGRIEGEGTCLLYVESNVFEGSQ
jgi:hypothetical protein